MASTLKGVGKNEMLSDVRGLRGGGVEWGLAGILDVQSLFFLFKEKWICAMTRYHAEPNINILLTRNLSFISDAKLWNNPLMIPFNCLWAKSNNRTRGILLNVTWLGFVFVFSWYVHMYCAVYVFKLCR